ncbi:MAG: helix-turn-helix transcriptional regulator [Acidobacteriota bacterium]
MLDFSNIGQALRKLRQARKLKQSEVAETAGITSPMLSAYETGKQRPSFSTIDKILVALGCSADDLTDAMRQEQQGNENAEPLLEELIRSLTNAGMSESEELLMEQVLPTLVAVLRHLRNE